MLLFQGNTYHLNGWAGYIGRSVFTLRCSRGHAVCATSATHNLVLYDMPYAVPIYCHWTGTDQSNHAFALTHPAPPLYLTNLLVCCYYWGLELCANISVSFSCSGTLTQAGGDVCSVVTTSPELSVECCASPLPLPINIMLPSMV